ncbi:uncharacterized protein LOC143206572 isoform X2 [Rhynchophorus ferrugineus]
MLILTAIIFYCIRWLRGRKKITNQLYIVEDLGFVNNKTSLLDIANNFTTYRKYSDTDHSDILLHYQSAPTDSGLSDSTDLSNKFTNSYLRINPKADDMHSCISTDSLGTYISTYTANSRKSFVTCSEGSEHGE